MGFLGHKSKHEREWEEVRASAQEDLVALGDDIRSLDVDIQMPGVSADAKQRYGQALEAYTRAGEIFDRAHRPEELAPVTESLEEGRYAMSAAKALIAGEPIPERRPPCFFDPRHGPSVEDVDWAPPGGQARRIPTCAADALRIKEGFTPHGRQVAVNGRMTDYWNAPAHFGPYAGGYYQGFGGGLVSTLLMGSALGAGLGLGAEVVGGLFGDGDGDGDGGLFGDGDGDGGGLFGGGDGDGDGGGLFGGDGDGGGDFGGDGGGGDW